jgi:predicted GIY-YIG superfamily endonuclease
MDKKSISQAQEDAADTQPCGAERIALYLKTLPNAPGVYRMLNARGDVLYVGKAKNLKKRVAAYTKPEAQSYRIARMISETTEMIFISTASETEALLLEANLIKRLKPRYPSRRRRPSIPHSTPCSVPFCCVPAPMRCSRGGHDPASSIKSNAAPAPASGALTRRVIRNWLPRPRIF